MHAYLLSLNAAFQEQADSEKALAIRAYLRNQFETFGLPTPLRRHITNQHMKKGLPDYKTLPAIVKACWRLPQREWQYFAIELVVAEKKNWDKPLIRLIEFMITHKSWWDSVDHIASELTGPYFTLFPGNTESLTRKWNQSNNIWLQRSSIMFQKSYKVKTNTILLSRYILNQAGSKEFFIQKAIGWSLREFSKSNPAWVIQFVKQHKLSSLSKKEALKRVKK